MNFRRWITALAVLALFAGFANAQILSSTAGTGPFQCTASVAVPPVLRSEGLTELVGDIVLTCTGGPTPVPNTVLPTANVTVSFSTNVTSRLLSYTASTVPSTVMSPNTSEALLMIDEPGSGLQVGGSPGTALVGPAANQTLCTSGGFPASYMGAGPGGCPDYVVQLPGGEYVMSSTSGTYGQPYNIFAGIASSNQVTFMGVPILPPTSAQISRVYRMTNIRINSAALGASGFNGTFQVQASISISGSTSVPVYPPVQVAGFVQSGLSVGMRSTSTTGFSVPTYGQCQTQNVVTGVGIMQFNENFGTAFKTRVAPLGASPSGQYNSGLQNIPGAIYNSESGFILGTLGSSSTLPATAGLADFGTRLKATFNNIPTGVRIFVSTTNVVNLTGTVPALLSAPPGNSTTSFAQLVISETATEGSTVPASGYNNAAAPNTTQLNGYAELAQQNNSATAVWEVINANSALSESFSFGVWTAYTANAGANSPPVGTATVNMSYAPTAGPNTFTASAGAAAAANMVLPRFADNSTGTSLLSIVQCSTSLLFPFITSQIGFDTGIALMNTTVDPYNTKAQNGICNMYFYGNNAPPNPTPTPIIKAGNPDAPANNWAFMASNIAPNFEGYMIAICNFQMAHGYAFVSDLGSQKLAHGYLALILKGTPAAGGSRGNDNPEILEN